MSGFVARGEGSGGQLGGAEGRQSEENDNEGKRFHARNARETRIEDITVAVERTTHFHGGIYQNARVRVAYRPNFHFALTALEGGRGTKSGST